MNLTLYQTLEDKGNVDEIEEHGPYLATGNTNWLGNGYYFWDTHIELAKWWGKIRYSVDGHIICKANAIMDEGCWDLHGNGIHRMELHALCSTIVNAGYQTKEKLYLSKVIEFLKREGGFKYDSIRVLGVNSMSEVDNSLYVWKIPFVSKHSNRYLDLIPPIQLCLVKKNSLSLKNYSVVYPVHYLENYG